MSLQEAYDHKPKRPLNTYMRFSVKRKAELKDSDVNIADTIKKEWEQLSESDKLKLKKEVDEEMEKYEQHMASWRKKYNIQDKSKKSKAKKDEDGQTKAEKSKGKKNDKSAEKNKKGKSAEKDKSNKKDDKKGKSKGKK